MDHPWPVYLSPFFGLAASLLIAMPALAGSPIVEARTDQLVWSVSEPVDSARITLTGPGDFFLQQHFEFDGPWSLPLWSLDPPMIDGAYRWRLELLFPNPSTKPRKRDSQVVTGILQMRDGHWISPPRKTLQEPRELDIAEAEPGIHVAESGRVGLGTSTPAAQAHIVDGEAPTLRLEQDITADRPPQTWDIEADDQAFSIRDQTRGTEPLRIEAGAPDSSLFIAADGRVGLAGPPTNPGVQLQVPGTVAITDQLQVQSSQDSDVWLINNRGNQLEFSKIGTEAVEMTLNDNGDLKLEGSLEVEGLIQESLDLGQYSLIENQGTLSMTRLGASPFKLRPEAPENSLFISDQGYVGIGHDNPIAALHVESEDRLAMRLTSKDFRTQFEMENQLAGQAWRFDINAAGTFLLFDSTTGFNPLSIATSTNGITFNSPVTILGDLGHLTVHGLTTSTLGFTTGDFSLSGSAETFKISKDGTTPFKLHASAPEDSLFVDDRGYIGVGHESPEAPIHVKHDESSLAMRLTNGGPRLQLEMEHTGAIVPGGVGSGQIWRLDINSVGQLTFIDTNSGVNILRLDPISGNTTIAGTLTATLGGQNLTGTHERLNLANEPMPLRELDRYIQAHQKLPNLPSSQDIQDRGLNMTEVQLELMAKMGELTLYILQQQAEIDQLRNELRGSPPRGSR